MGRVITLENVTKRYGQFTAVNDVSFVATAGDRSPGSSVPTAPASRPACASWSGSTPQDGGRAPIGGHLYSEIPNPARHVGVLLDASAQHAGRTGREVLRLSAETMGVGSARVEEMLELVGLSGGEAKRRVRNYSLGMRQRLGIANALMGEPVDPDPRRAGQRPRPGRHPLDARPAAQLRRAGRHGAAVLAPAPRGRDDRRRDGAHRPRQDRRAGHQGGAAPDRRAPT